MMGDEPFDTGMMIWLDPPKHTTIRNLVSRAFTAKRLTMVEDRVHEVSARLLDAQLGASKFDYVQDFAAILPPTIISTLLGVPEADQDEMRHVIDGIFHIEEGVGMANETSTASRARLDEYLDGQLADRRRNPRDDMFSALVQAEITEDGAVRRLTEYEAVEFGVMLFVAGTETVARHLSWAAKVLAENPDQRAELAADHSLIPNAVEELLRFEPPSPVNARWTTREVRLHDVTIPKDSKVVLLTGSAGRDERKYPDPDRFDMRRKTDLHLTFGYGIHFCLGAALARMESRIGIEETLKRWREWDIDYPNAVPLYTSTVRGYLNLPVFV
jgi:cytochrome P450